MQILSSFQSIEREHDLNEPITKVFFNALSFPIFFSLSMFQ